MKRFLIAIDHLIIQVMVRLSNAISIVFICVLFSSNTVFGQYSSTATQPVKLQVAGSALLGISGPSVTLQLAGATEAGAPIQESVENNSSRLRITSLVENGESRAISAKISEPLVGTQLYIELGTPNTNFMYPENMGVFKGVQLLSDESEVILIDGIKTCWSDTHEGDGYVLKYTFKAIPNAPILKNATITVIYTISMVSSDSNN